MPKISIIIPVFNAKKYLSCCLKSIASQTFADLEIIAVDDESTDGSHEILKAFQLKEDRLRIIRKKCNGPSFTRGLGIQESRGEYIMFIDADDSIEPQTCEIAYNTAKQYNADVVFWSYISEYRDTKKAKEIFNEDILIFDKNEVKNKLHRRLFGLLDEELRFPEKADILSTVWAKLYKSCIIKDNKIGFIDNRLIGAYEDGMFNLHAFNFVNKAVYINKHLYRYRKISSNESFSNSYKKDLPERWETLYKIMESYIKDNSLGREYSEALNNRVCLSILGIGLQELNPNNPKNIFQRIKSVGYLLNNPRYYNAYKKLKMSYLPVPWKILMFFAKIRFAAGVYMVLWFAKKIREN